MPEESYNFPYHVTICYILNAKGQVLLQKKARGFGKGNWNGPGGKIDPGESPEQCAIREVKEETDLEITNLREVAVIEFVFPHDPASNNYSYVFLTNDYKGTPKDLGEGELCWFDVDNIPYEKMWDDDKYWLPQVLAGEKIKKRFYFDNNKKITKHLNL